MPRFNQNCIAPNVAFSTATFQDRVRAEDLEAPFGSDPNRRRNLSKIRCTHCALSATCGSAMTLPPRIVAPTSRPAQTSTRFLIMYCPNSVGA
jgi:hypothetical protein